MDIHTLLKSKSYVNLDLEGGRNIQKGFITMHSSPLEGVDVVHHYDTLPWPFPDGTISLLRADSVVQKVSRDNKHFINFMNEAWRVLKYDGEFMMSVPYSNSYLFTADPGSVNPMNESTFTYFDPLEPLAGIHNYFIYEPAPWKLKHVSFKGEGLMEVLLSKRRDDVSFHNDRTIHYGK